MLIGDVPSHGVDLARLAVVFNFSGCVIRQYDGSVVKQAADLSGDLHDGGTSAFLPKASLHLASLLGQAQVLGAYRVF